MENIKFNKTECGVDLFINVLSKHIITDKYLSKTPFITDYFEMVFIKKGSGKVLINNDLIDIKPQSVLFISANQRREWRLENEEVDFEILIFTDTFLNEFFADKLFTYKLLYFYQYDYPLYIVEDSKDFDSRLSILKEIKYELENPKVDSVHIVRSLLYYLLQVLNRKYAFSYNLSLHRLENNCAHMFKELLEKNITTKQRVNDYTEMLGISRIALNNNVQKYFNTTPSTMIKKRLLNEIQNQLIYSGLSINEISEHLNFSEPNHLMRFFKAQTNQTIVEYKGQYK